MFLSAAGNHAQGLKLAAGKLDSPVYQVAVWSNVVVSWFGYKLEKQWAQSSVVGGVFCITCLFGIHIGKPAFRNFDFSFHLNLHSIERAGASLNQSQS